MACGLIRPGNLSALRAGGSVVRAVTVHGYRPRRAFAALHSRQYPPHVDYVHDGHVTACTRASTTSTDIVSGAAGHPSGDAGGSGETVHDGAPATHRRRFANVGGRPHPAG